MYNFINETDQDMTDILDFMDDFIPTIKDKYDFDKTFTVILVSDEENSNNPLGKTGFYNPKDLSATIYTSNRHKKDIMRSISHEAIHHVQNCRGSFDNSLYEESDDDYAQTNSHLREMEKEAYLEGNMSFRDWEDSRKKSLREDQYNNFLFNKLMETV